MTKITKPAPPVILSKNLSDYKLTKRHQGVLQAWEKMRAYMRLANKAPPCVRLTRADYADIDAAVRNQSDGKRDLSMVKYEGVPVYSTEVSPQMDALA